MSEVRLIDANALKKDVEENSIVFNGVRVIEVDCAKALIDNAPTVEQPQGGWKYTHDTFSKRVCNKCNYSQVIVDGMADNYCPNCGAKMANSAK